MTNHPVESAQTTLSELEETDVAELFGPTGPLAAALEGYELRASQVEMAQAVKRALLAQKHGLVEAPTGTGKSIAYLIPAILTGRTVVVATANKSLQYQLYSKDIPFLRQVLARPIPAVVVKGRSNFICTYKWEKELAEQRTISMYDREDEQVRHIRRWLGSTETGDIDDLPFVLGSDLRPRVVSFPDDCLQRDCRHFSDDCWVNHMRDVAAEAQVIITNHHLLLNALELGEAGERMLPPSTIYIIDEAHQLEQTATAVYETNVTDHTVEQLLIRSTFREYVDEAELDELRFLNTMAFQEAANQSRDNSSYELAGELEQMLRLSHKLRDLGQRLKRENPFGGTAEEGSRQAQNDGEESEKRRAYELVLEALSSAASKLATIAMEPRNGELVRYAVRVFERRRVSLELHAAPIDASSLLSRHLFHPEEEEGDQPARTVICTSATLATGGNFAHFKQRCGIRATGEELVLPPVFDYPQQAVLYQPALPTFTGRNQDAYYAAAAQEIARLLEVSRGRALCLFTSWSGLQLVSNQLSGLEQRVIWPVRAQGDAPRNALLSWFLETPNSVLLATRSFWEGVDIPGEDLSLVVVDKLPFPTPGDPLHAARMRAIDTAGKSSFGEYMVPLMTLALKQGFGRLIRRGDDRGVVAILDERLTGKSYGRRTLQDLPPAPMSRNFRAVEQFFHRVMAHTVHFALNVWVRQEDDLRAKPGKGAGEFSWRWQLIRLTDGKSDMGEGRVPAESPVEAELVAVEQGLRNLQGRIRAAGRREDEFCVEVRCSAAACEPAESMLPVRLLPADSQALFTCWREVIWLPILREHETEVPAPVGTG